MWDFVCSSWWGKRFKTQRSPRRRPAAPFRRTILRLEELERRLAPATFIVNTTGDPNAPQKDTSLSLRAAILVIDGTLTKAQLDAKAQPQIQGAIGVAGKPDIIKFDIGNGAQTIGINPKDLGALPAFTKPVIIDGSAPAGKPNQKITIGIAAGKFALANGLTFNAGSDNSEVLGLTVNGFLAGDGILLNNVTFVTVGGTGANQSMTLTGNKNGLEISGANAKHNKVIHSFIGTNSNSANLANVAEGVLIDNGASANSIGGLDSTELNVISANKDAGIMINGAGGNQIMGNYIGTNVDGTKALGNKTGILIGIAARNNSAGNTIGAVVRTEKGVIVTPANVISGNVSGIAIFGAAGTTIQGNFIGTDKGGNTGLGNSLQGIVLGAVTQGQTLIGGGQAGAYNVISANGTNPPPPRQIDPGIEVEGSTGIVIQDNKIGTGNDPKVALGNVSAGIHFDNQSPGNIVKGNKKITNNPKAVLDDTGGKNKIFDPNSIVGNGFGIDIGTRAGAPVLSSAVVSGNTVTVTGTLSSTPNTQFGLEFFGNSVEDPSGYGEGEQWLSTAYVTTNGSGNASFVVTLPAIYGSWLSATATSMASGGGTSEFSNDVAISGESQYAAVGGNVWDDTNLDGLPETGEPEMSNVTVQLFTSSGSFVTSTTTGATGNYLFTGLAPGDYYLQFTAPSGYSFTAPFQGDAAFASHADLSTGDTEVFTLLAGEVYPDINAGLIPTSAQPTTSTTLAADENPSAFGDQVTFTATVSQTDSIALGGTVTFEDGSIVLGTVQLTPYGSSYQAAFSTSALSLGNHTITAIYNGDGFHLGSSASLTQTVQQGYTFTSLTSSNNPALPGQPVTFTATVDGFGAMPTGTVTFDDGTTQLGTATLDANGNATFTTSTLAAGDHDITAVYGGDSNFLGSTSAVLTQVISQETTSSVSLTSSANPAKGGQTVTFTATLSGNSGTPTGSVTFQDDTTVLGTASLDANGHATLTTSALDLGSQTITAIYGGDSTYGSNSASLTQQVNQVGSTTYLTSSNSNAPPNQSVTFTATLTGQDSGTPTGTVTFLDGTTVLGTGTLAVVNGQDQATFSTSTLALGSHDIIAIYSGDSTYSDSDATLTQNISLTASGTILTSSANPSQSGQSVTFTATVTGMDNGAPTGTVTFLDGTTVLGTGTLDGVSGNDQATFTTTALTSGNHTITAIYGGDGTYAGSDGWLTQTVGQANGNGSSTYLTSSAGSARPGQSVTFTAVVAGMGGTPTGTVTFQDGTTVLGTGTLSVVNGQAQATFSTSTLALGTHNIIAIYGGDSSFNSSQSSLTETISLASTSTSLSSSASSASAGQSVTFTATVSGSGGTPTGTVTFLDGTTVLGTGTLNANGQATFTTSSLELGSDAIVAIYSGDSTFAGSSTSLTETISQVATSLALSSSANPSKLGQAVTFTVILTGADGGTPTGTVTFMDGDTVLGVATLSVVNGQVEATFTTSALGLGSHDITAIYSGDGTYASSAASFLQTVGMT